MVTPHDAAAPRALCGSPTVHDTYTHLVTDLKNKKNGGPKLLKKLKTIREPSGKKRTVSPKAGITLAPLG